MIKRPDYLQPNDSIGITATARSVRRDEILKAIEVFETWGLQVVLADHLFDVHDQFAGNDEARRFSLQKMINDPAIKAIVCARGGYGTTRIIDEIDFSPLKKNPKWIVGFSDITVLLYHLYNQGIASVHGIMAGLFDKEGRKESIESLHDVLFGKQITITAANHQFNKLGEASGPVIGGNLSIINNIIGTASDVDTAGKILFIEDLDEYLYHIDRMMVQLKRAGKLQKLKGLIVGDMSAMNDNQIPFGKNAYEIIQEHVESYAYPVCFGFPVGHEARNLAIPFGSTGTLVVKEEGATLVFKE